MSEISTRFNEHSMWIELDTALDASKKIQTEGIPLEKVEALFYCIEVLENLKVRKLETVAAEVTPKMLSVTNTACTQLSALLSPDSFLSATANNLITAGDGITDSLANWPNLKSSKYVNGLKGSVDTFTQTVHNSLEKLSKTTSSLEEQLVAISSTQSSIETKISSSKLEVTNLISESQKNISNALDEQLLNEQEQNELLREQWREEQNQFKRSAASNIEELSELKDSALNTVSAVAAFAIAADYGRYARNKSIAAWVTDLIAVGIGIIGVSAIFIHLFSLDPTFDGNIGISLTRLAAAIGVLGLSGLVAKRATAHHREALAAKRTDLALRKVGPFVANLPHEDQMEIFKEITQRIFIRGDLDAPGVTKMPLRPFTKSSSGSQIDETIS